ncbi:type I phosphodiesterase/nucleotide pyrophosphatase [Cadophora sp. MPI-SDFR-AT-0126]|nr:type I phosphodiesterase/nucleotide pyrophosphatase [Leotiomycetes sp. MPI-SDFR-AT-0126]
MLLQSVILVAATFSKQVFASHGKIYKYVAAFSIDGLHSSDVEKYVALRPESTIASLLSTGYEYTDAYTSGPSDSFPGTMNLFTGSSPRTTRVWYDDTYDRSFWPPFSTTGSNCSGPPGAEVVYDESKDYDSTMLFSGGINPLNLPQTLVSEKCVNLYPHSRLRVNTAFEVVHAAGHQTAYTDKHPAYDIVRGPSGAGLSVGYFPEIAAVDADVDSTIAYDKLHVKAFLDWINAKTPVNSTIYEPLKTIPTLFGGNFQAVSVGQKVYGYVKGTLAFTPQLLKAYDFVDASLGQVVAALKAKSILEDTLIIVASKHGQAPIDPTLYGKVDPALLNLIIKVPVESITTDDIALIFLQNHADTDAAVDNLNRNRNTLKIADIISGDRLTYLGYGDPKTDPAVPDIIVRPDTGIIYTTSKSKIAEHGGLSDDDRKVACFVSNPGLKKTVYDHRVSTAQVAPTILEALGLDAQALQGVVAEKTRLLDGF